MIGGDNPWLDGTGLGLGGLILASLYTLVQYIVFAIIFMIMAALGGFLYNHFIKLRAAKTYD